MKWFCRYRNKDAAEDSLLGPYLSQGDAAAAAAMLQEADATIVNAAFSAPDDYPRTWRPVEVAVVTKADGLYRVMSDGTETKIEE